MKLLLHIGPPKSGTSAIQQSLSSSQEDLMKKGIYVFAPEKMMNQALSLDLYNRDRMTKAGVVKNFRSARGAQKWSARNWDILAKEVAEKKPALTILSEEFFFGVPDKVEFQRRLATMFDTITVVAYLRDPVARFTSGVNQRIRTGKSLDTILATNKALPVFAPVLKEFEDAFGKEAMLIRHFDRANFVDESLEADFSAIISKLSGTEVSLPVNTKTVNESLPGAAVAALLLMNETWIFSHDATDRPMVAKRQTLLKKMRKSKKIMALPKFTLTDDAIEQHLLAAYNDDIKWINETYFQNQTRIPQSDGAKRLSARKLTRHMTNWVFSYLDSDAAKVVAAVALEEPKAPGSKASKTKRPKSARPKAARLKSARLKTAGSKAARSKATRNKAAQKTRKRAVGKNQRLRSSA